MVHLYLLRRRWEVSRQLVLIVGYQYLRRQRWDALLVGQVHCRKEVARWTVLTILLVGHLYLLRRRWEVSRQSVLIVGYQYLLHRRWDDLLERAFLVLVWILV